MTEKVLTLNSIREDYWENFQIDSEDIDYLYSYLLDVETPLTPDELVAALVRERIQREKREIEQRRSAGGDIYLPRLHYKIGQSIVFPALDWKHAQVAGVRPGVNPDVGDFEVIEVDFGDESIREFAAGLEDHVLNNPTDTDDTDSQYNLASILVEHGDNLVSALLEELMTNPDFVYIAGRWFPRALLIDVNLGHLNLAEAALDMAGGGPLSTEALLEEIELPVDINQKLVEFSLDLALQEDDRFDEVGPTGKVLWYLNKLEPPEVLNTPVYLRDTHLEYDRSVLDEEMINLETQLADELSPLEPVDDPPDEVSIPLIFPHWISGTLPLSARMAGIFPTAYDAPRIRITFIDGETGDQLSGWVVRNSRYVYGLKQWYQDHGLIPGSNLRVRKGDVPGEVVIGTEGHRSAREYIRTALVGADGGLVFALLKQTITATIDDRMVISVPDPEALDGVWRQIKTDKIPFERSVVDMFRELSKLTAQSHVHAIELYAAVNLVRRAPPGPIFALLASRPWFDHLGDFYYRMSDFEG